MEWTYIYMIHDVRWPNLFILNTIEVYCIPNSHSPILPTFNPPITDPNMSRIKKSKPKPNFGYWSRGIISIVLWCSWGDKNVYKWYVCDFNLHKLGYGTPTTMVNYHPLIMVPLRLQVWLDNVGQMVNSYFRWVT